MTPDAVPVDARTVLAIVLAAAAVLAGLRAPSFPPGRRAARWLLRLAAATALAAVAMYAAPVRGPEMPLRVIVLEEHGPLGAPTPAIVPEIEQALRRASPLARIEVRPFSSAAAGVAAAPGGTPAAPVSASGHAPAAPATAVPNLPEALGAALARHSPGARTVVLIAGRAAARDTDALLGQAVALGRAGVPVLALAPPADQVDQADQAIRQALSAPHRVFPGERYDVRLLATAKRSGPVSVELFRGDALEQSRAVSLAAGVEQEATFAQTAPASGPLRYRTRLRGEDGAAIPGGERLVAVEVAPPLAVAYVTASPSDAGPLPGLLERAGMRVRVLGPEQWLRGADGPPGVIVLDDVPVEALGEEGMERLERHVRGGPAGLLVVGGTRGLGSGEYRDTLLERVLPVTAGPPPGGPDADVGLAIVLDTSLSMYFRSRGAGDASGSPRKIEVARLAILEVVRALRPNDRIGLLASADRLTWIRRPALLDDRAEFEARVMSLHAIGGGINFYSSIREAAAALQEVPTRLRHVMVVADSDDIDQLEVQDEGRSEELVRALAEQGVTLSIFAIGYPSDKDVLFLKRMTSLGRGDFYLVPDIGNLPRFFRAEYQRRTGEWYREEEFLPLVRDYNPLLRGIDPGAFPGLGGLDLLAAKPGAEEVLVSPFGTPLLALWGYGRGRAAVFASDSGARWAAGWSGWADAERFWAQLLYALVPPPPPPAIEVRAETDGQAGLVRFSLRGGDGSALPAGPARIAFGDPAATQPLLRRGVERFESPLPARGAVGAAFRITGPWPPGEGAAAGILAAPAEDIGREQAQARAAVDALVAGSGGAWIDRAGDLERHLAPLSGRRFDPVFWLLLVALVALAGEVLLRD